MNIPPLIVKNFETLHGDVKTINDSVATLNIYSAWFKENLDRLNKSDEQLHLTIRGLMARLNTLEIAYNVFIDNHLTFHARGGDAGEKERKEASDSLRKNRSGAAPAGNLEAR